MKKYSKLLILLGVLAAVIIAIFAVKGVKQEKERIEKTDEVVLRIPPESVSTLSWENESGTFSFHKEGEDWKYDADETFPTDNEKILKLLSVFKEFGVSFIINEVEDYAQYGLADPVGTVHIQAADGGHDILMGEYSTMDEQRYVSVGDGKVYLVGDDPMDLFKAELVDVTKNDKNLSYTAISKITSEGAEPMEIVEKDYTETSSDTYDSTDIYFLAEEGEKKPLDTALVKNYLAAVSAVDLTHYASYNVTDEELAGFGLDAPELTVTIDYFDGPEAETPEAYTFAISRTDETRKKEEEKEAADGENAAQTAEAPADDFKAYIRIGESQIVYPLSRTSFETLYDLSYDKLRHKKVFSGSMAGINTFNVTLDGTEYRIPSEEGNNGVKYFIYDAEIVDTNKIQTAMADLEVTEFTDAEPDDKLEVAVKLELDNPNYKEVTFELYRYDGANMLAKVNGKSFGLVPRTSAVVFMESVYSIVLGRRG